MEPSTGLGNGMKINLYTFVICVTSTTNKQHLSEMQQSLINYCSMSPLYPMIPDPYIDNGKTDTIPFQIQQSVNLQRDYCWHQISTPRRRCNKVVFVHPCSLMTNKKVG